MAWSGEALRARTTRPKQTIQEILRRTESAPGHQGVTSLRAPLAAPLDGKSNGGYDLLREREGTQV